MQNKKIFLVDDQLRWRSIFKALLFQKTRDIDVIECGSLETALKALKENQDIDLAILDLRLNGDETNDIEGLRLLREVKKQSAKTKIIFATAYPDILGDKLQEAQEEADVFFDKVPNQGNFDIKDFQEKAMQLIGFTEPTTASL